jgi:hypothetical protein
MRHYEDFLKITQTHGYNGSVNICDYYFKHRRALDSLFFGQNVANDEFALKVRWKSQRGVACVDAIKLYLKSKMEAKAEESAKWFRGDQMLTDPNWQKNLDAKEPNLFAEIDFEDFRFDWEGRPWSLAEFTYSFQTGRIFPQKDLIGIDLSGVRLRNVRLVNLAFGGACFDDADFFQIELENTSFPQASFRRARLMTVRTSNGSFFNNADMTAAGVFGIHPFSDQSLTAPIAYTQISYWRLVFQTLKTLLRFKSQLAPGWEAGRHTSFMNNTVTGLTRPETRAIREYITWYQFIMARLANFRTAPILSQVGFVSSVIATKYWTSYKALAVVALLLDVIFAIFFYLAPHHFTSHGATFLDCFYTSTLIFTSLGVEGIKPITHFGQLTVIAEVITGYMILAIFIFLIARKVERKY